MLLEELTANIRAAAEENASRGEGIALGIRRRCRRRGAACKSDRIRICTNQNCRTMTTPLWRRGPLGPQTLCNACGIYYRKRERGLSVVVPDAASSSNGVPANNDASSSSVPSSPAVPVKVEPAASVKMEPAASVKVEPDASVKVEPAVSVKMEPAAVSVKVEP